MQGRCRLLKRSALPLQRIVTISNSNISFWYWIWASIAAAIGSLIEVPVLISLVSVAHSGCRKNILVNRKKIIYLFQTNFQYKIIFLLIGI
jgi:3-methyladenine DNA glycosylase/8-oxoguanine DNA glycosylase